MEAQGGDPRVIESPDLLPSAPVVRTVESGADGYLLELDAREVGIAAVELGAGRTRVDDRVDPAVGFELHVAPGDPVARADPLVTIHARDEASLARAAHRVGELARIGPEPPSLPPLVLDRIRSAADAD